ncbi:hypothetical protein BH11PLA2_BH11PLA2_16580 [soil metagenome]
MATKINDLADTTRLAQSFGPFNATDTTITTDAVDLIDGDGPAFALISVGEMNGGATVQAGLQSSPDGGTWEDVPNGIFPEETNPSNIVLAKTFQRPHRYVRATIVVSNDSDPAPLSVLIGQGRKQI